MIGVVGIKVGSSSQFNTKSPSSPQPVDLGAVAEDVFVYMMLVMIDVDVGAAGIGPFV